jgi:hypothetical protein
MRSVLLARPNRYYQARIIAERGGDLCRIQLLYAERTCRRKGGGKAHRVES